MRTRDMYTVDSIVVVARIFYLSLNEILISFNPVEIPWKKYESYCFVSDS